ncbi:MAG: hypothetical protein U1E15_09600 [Hyphomicrobiales bacterium]
MKRILIALPLTAALALSAFAASGVKVTNNSGLPIDELFAAAPGTTDWGKNLLDGVAEGALDSGKAYNVAGLADGKYDLKISAPDEAVLCTMKDVEVKGGAVELTPDMGKAAS